MEFKKEIFKKVLKECGIIRWETHFEKVVKCYLKNQKEELKQGQELPIHSVVGSALLKDLLDRSEEVIAINGLRFTGTHEEKIKQVFDRHGIKYEPPF